MGLLSRYQKKGGFVQLLSLIETSEPAKVEKFLQLIAQENQAWTDFILEKRLTMNKLLILNDRIINESIEHLPPSIIGIGLFKESEAFKTQILSRLSSTTQKKVENILRDIPEPRPGDIISCQIKIFQAVRKALEKFRYSKELIPKELEIPENIETQLNFNSATKKFNQITSSSHQSSSSVSVSTIPHQNPHSITSTKRATPTETTPASSFPSDATTTSPLSFSSSFNTIKTDLQKENEELHRNIKSLTEENIQLKNQINELQKQLNQIKKLVS